jgi:hypothetical protein
VLENKGAGLEKERQERQGVRKPLKIGSLLDRHVAEALETEYLDPDQARTWQRWVPAADLDPRRMACKENET